MQLRSRAWRDGEVIASDFDLSELDGYLANASVLTWLDVCDPHGSVIVKLAEELQLDPHAVEDAIAPRERAKVTRHATHTFFTCYSAELGENAAGLPELTTGRISAFVMVNGLITDEELRAMVTSSSTLGDEERQIVDEVFAAGQVSLREAMVPRTEVDFLSGDMPAYKAIRAFQDSPHSRYPVIGEDVDDVLGFVHVRDLFDLDPTARNAPVRQLVRPVESLPHTMKILRALSELRAANAHLVIVRDEYGGTAGIVTMEDLVEELVGDISDEFDRPTEAPVMSPSSSEVDGLETIEEFGETNGYVLPEGPYDTVAGFVMAHLGHLPELGDSVEVLLDPVEMGEAEPETFEFTVTELDGRRAARIKVRRLGTTPEPGADDRS